MWSRASFPSLHHRKEGNMPQRTIRSHLLFHQFDVTDPAGGIPGPPDAVRIARIDLDPAMIFFRVSERELCEGLRRRIETRDLIGMLLAEPDQFAFRIALHGIR